MKLVGRECTAEEKAELRRLLEEEPGRRELLQKLCDSVGIARELLPLVSALEATEGRMSAGEMEYFRLAVARRRENRRESGAAAAETSGGGDQGPSIIDAEVVPEKRFNGYKLGFYALLLLILIAGCVVLVKSCGPRNPVAASGDNRGQNGSGVPDSTSAQASQPNTPATAAPTPANRVQEVPATSSATKSKLKNYRGSKWTKLTDGNALPGSMLFFRRFVGPDQTSPLIEGLIGPNGGIPKTFMLFTQQGKSWNARSFPDVFTEPKLAIALDRSRTLIAARGMHREVYLTENGQSHEVILPEEINCIGAHSDSGGRIFIHEYYGNVFAVSGRSVTRLPETDPNNYIHHHGELTGLRRGHVHVIAKADSGDTMGVHYPEPTTLGRGSLVRFTGSGWELVCSLGEKYPDQAPHYLSQDSMVAAWSRELLVVKDGVPMSPAIPVEFDGMRSAEWMAVHAASTDDFVAVDNSGGVYCYFDGKFEQAVEPGPAFQGVGNIGLRSVMIAPDGVIYAIHAWNVWSTSTLYQLTPK